VKNFSFVITDYFWRTRFQHWCVCCVKSGKTHLKYSYFLVSCLRLSVWQRL